MILIIKTATRWCKNIRIFTTRLCKNIKIFTRWCKNIKIFTRWCKNIEIFTRWCKNTKEPWYSDSVVSYLEEQRALVGVLYKDNFPGSFSSFHIFTKGQQWSHTTRMSRSISGIFFVLPCIEAYQKVDLRTITLGVPPQEVSISKPWLWTLTNAHFHSAQPNSQFFSQIALKKRN